jgi:hypothetical protein
MLGLGFAVGRLIPVPAAAAVAASADEVHGTNGTSEGNHTSGVLAILSLEVVLIHTL